MEYSTGKRVGVVGITVAILMLALISQTYPSASASRVLFHGSLIKSEILSPQVGIQQQLILPKIVVSPPNIDPPVTNLQTLFKHHTPLQTEVPNSNPPTSIPNTFPSEDFVKRIIEKATGSSSGRSSDNSGGSSSGGSSDNSGGSSSGGSSDNSGGSSSGGSSDNSGTTENVEIIHHSDGSDTWSSDSDHHHNSLDIQDKSFLKGIKITDVDRSNPHLLKVTLERHSGNLPKYVAVVAVGKDGQTISGSTTIRSDDISNTLTVNVVLKNKNDKNGHLDQSADVIVWVVPAALSL
jgi:hypothetical protein